ncbi:MAG: hypothetical protein ACJ78M_13605 [Gemmatimonadaceae bacterium]
MSNPHHPMSHSLDPYPVRPGTSDALTARTIDATVHTPLVRAQETVAAIIPRVAEPFSSPLFLASVGLTLVLVSFAIAGRFRPRGLVLAALLMMALTSFKPMRPVDDAEIPDRSVATDGESWWRVQFEKVAQPIVAAAVRYADQIETSRGAARAIAEVAPVDDDRTEYAIRSDPFDPSESPEHIIPPDVRIRIVVPREMMARYREQELRASIEELRMRVRDEVRRRYRHRY